MSETRAELSEIPPALPVGEDFESREKLLREAADVHQKEVENSLVEPEEDELEELAETPKASKKKLFFAFVCFIFGFVGLVLLMSWFFRIGAFAASKPQAVDRTKQTNSSNPAPVTEEEKMKMALNLVAEKNPNGSNSNVSSGNEQGAANSSVDIPPTRVADVQPPVIVPDPLVETNRNQANSSTQNTNVYPNKTPVPYVSSSQKNGANDKRIKDSSVQPMSEANNAPLGRSLFFGIEQTEAAVTNTVTTTNKQAIPTNQKINLTDQIIPSIPFGTLLPVRFLGAVYTLRSAGGFVRMELTRNVSGKNYSYPAGTVLVGNLRGSERSRAFLSVIGLIDPARGGLVKLTGEVMGNDGASGVTGKKRQIKSTWSRIFEGLREAGSVAVGTLGNRRSGGTVVISDSTSKVSGELSGLIGNNRNSNEFVEISAGTTGFVLVTDLPDEISDAGGSRQNSKIATGLSETELADLFSEGNKEKIRAALPRMTPQFRVLAEKYLAMEEK